MGWRRERFEWGKLLEEQLLNLISSVQWSTEGCDKMVWLGNEKQEYSVKVGYSMLNLEDQMLSLEVFEMLWNLKVVPSAIVCV